MKAAVYCRVSTDEQRDKQSIDTQIEFATRYTQLHSMEIVEFYKDDGVSGGVPCDKRPEAARMLADAKAGKFDLLLIYRVDRLSRSLIDLLHTTEVLEEWGTTLRSMTEPFDTATPLGKFVLQLLGMLAELEKSNIRDRSVAGSMRCAREGKWLGGLAPLGYKIDSGKLVVDTDEAALVDRIFTLCAQEQMSLAQIADLLNAEGIPMRNDMRRKGKAGKGWHTSTLSRILKNTTYLGQNVYNKRKSVRKSGQIVGHELTRTDEQITRMAPPIIDPAIFAQARAFIKDNNQKPSNASREYLLRGLIKCALCGNSYSGVQPSGRNLFYYKCTRYMASRSLARCDAVIVRGDLLEAQIWNDIVDFARNPGKVMDKLRAQAQAQTNALAPVEIEQNLIRKGIEEKHLERQRIIAFVRKALITDAEAETELTNLQREIEVLEQRGVALAERGAQAHELRAKLEDADAILAKLAQAVDGATEQTKRGLMKLLVSSITVNTVIENGKKKAGINVLYAFDSAPECISSATHGSPKGATLIHSPLMLHRELSLAGHKMQVAAL